MGLIPKISTHESKNDSALWPKISSPLGVDYYETFLLFLQAMKTKTLIHHHFLIMSSGLQN